MTDHGTLDVVMAARFSSIPAMKRNQKMGSGHAFQQTSCRRAGGMKGVAT